MGLVHQKYKVAVVQAAPIFLDLDATVDKTIALIEQAAEQGAKLIAFPETFIPGYPWQAISITRCHLTARKPKKSARP